MHELFIQMLGLLIRKRSSQLLEEEPTSKRQSLTSSELIFNVVILCYMY